MPKADVPLGPAFEWRLRHALDRVRPPHSAPRYQSAPAGISLRTALWRAAPAMAVGIAGLLLTAFAATGSPNPVIWTKNAASAINSIAHPEASPTTEHPSAPEPARRTSQPSTDQAEATEAAEAGEAPKRAGTTDPQEPSDDSHGPEAARSPSDD